LEGGYGLPFRIMGRPLKGGPFHGGGGWKTVSPGYFEVFHIGVIRGRTFNDRDNQGAPPVVIINEALAKKHWPKGDPLQDRILIGKGVMPQFDPEQPRQIIGIVADQHDNGLNREAQPEMYIPNGQQPDAIQALNARLTPLAWVIRTRGDPLRVRSAVEQQLQQITGLPVSDVRTMEQVVSRSTSRERFHMLLMNVFAGVSLLLAAIGIYGLMSYSVAQRTQEIGIRMALGAEGDQVRGLIMRQGMIFTIAGVIAGIAGAFALAKQIATFLFGVKPWDPVVFSAIPIVIIATAILAVWWPAVRATQVDPATALRQA
jgi:predicted permease